MWRGHFNKGGCVISSHIVHCSWCGNLDAILEMLLFVAEFSWLAQFFLFVCCVTFYRGILKTWVKLINFIGLIILPIVLIIDPFGCFHSFLRGM